MILLMKATQWRRSALAIGAACAFAVALGASPARACAVTTCIVSPGTTATSNGLDLMSVTGNPGAANAITVLGDSTTKTVTVQDSTGVLAGPGCVSAGLTSAVCVSAATVSINTGDGDDQVSATIGTHLVIDGGDGNDTLSGTTTETGLHYESEFEIHGGNGNDNITGGGTWSGKLFGEAGADTLTAGGPVHDAAWGNTSLDGGIGNDVLRGGPNPVLMVWDSGADDMQAGSGGGQVDYGAANAGVVVTIDGTANDGVFGEGDNVRPGLSIVGSPYRDLLTGSALGERLRGQGGNDAIDGGAGDDELFGGDGNDDLTGGPGKDSLGGAEPGDDIFRLKDGERDWVGCGAGTDALFYDAGVDFVAWPGDCEAKS